MRPKLEEKNKRKILSVALRDDQREFVESFDPLGENSFTRGLEKILSLVNIFESTKQNKRGINEKRNNIKL